jgi:hypothetical protein
MSETCVIDVTVTTYGPYGNIVIDIDEDKLSQLFNDMFQSMFLKQEMQSLAELIDLSNLLQIIEKIGLSPISLVAGSANSIFQEQIKNWSQLNKKIKESEQAVKDYGSAIQETPKPNQTLDDWKTAFSALSGAFGNLAIVFKLFEGTGNRLFTLLAKNLPLLQTTFKSMSESADAWKNAKDLKGLDAFLTKVGVFAAYASAAISLVTTLWRAFTGPTNEDLAAGGAKELKNLFGVTIDPKSLLKLAEKLPRAESGKVDIEFAKVHPETLQQILKQLESFTPHVQAKFAQSIASGIGYLQSKLGLSLEQAFQKMQPVLQGSIAKAISSGEILDQKLLDLINHAKNLGIAIGASAKQFSQSLAEMIRSGSLTEEKITNIKFLAGQLGISLQRIAESLKSEMAKVLAEMIKSGVLSERKITDVINLAAGFGIALSEIGRRIKDDLIAAQFGLSWDDLALGSTVKTRTNEVDSGKRFLRIADGRKRLPLPLPTPHTLLTPLPLAA